MRRLRSKKQRASPNTRAVAGDVASTSASASKKRRTEKKTTTTTTDEDENEDVVVAKQIEKQQQKKQRGLPDELWLKILQDVDDNSVMAFACVSKQLRRVQKRSGRKLTTTLISLFNRKLGVAQVCTRAGKLNAFTTQCCLWMLQNAGSSMKKIRRSLLYNAAYFGDVKALRSCKFNMEHKALTGGIRSSTSLCDIGTAIIATAGGQKAVLLWLRKNGYPCLNEETCHYAAAGGHLEVLKYAHENGCPWDERTCYEAAGGGHLDVLKYLHEQGCPWDEWTYQAAAREGHLDVLKYLHEEGFPYE